MAKIAALFPQCVTERIGKDGKPELAVDFDKLREELSGEVLDAGEERYQFTWPDKKASGRLANTPTTMTLRPCPAESVDFDTTQNLYIEGDNLEVLKILREDYLGAIKMIYIDPPYNTGNDFVYNDDFARDYDETRRDIALRCKDEDGNIIETLDPMQRNTEANGRFHTDWLNMIYPRLKVARDLLTDDGIIFISINDKEVQNLKKICTEIFGQQNEIATLIWDKNHSAQAGIYKVYHEYILVFCRNKEELGNPSSLDNKLFEAGAMKKISRRHPASIFTFPAGTRFDAPNGFILDSDFGDAEKVEIVKGRMIAKDGKLAEEVTLRAGFTQANQMFQYFYGDKNSLVDSKGQKIVEFYFNSTGKIKVIKKRSVETPQTTCRFGTQGASSKELAALFGLVDCPFSSPKPVSMIFDFIQRFTETGDIVLDFFSGSATTAHAIFEGNATSKLGLKFILVQLQEDLDESLKHAQKDAVKALQTGIELLDSIQKPHNICEIGKERIRRAGKKVKEEAGLQGQDLDIGFRVLKLDSSNIEDVYYTPDDLTEQNLFNSVDNVKSDRTPLDLLFQVLPELNIELSARIEEKEIHGKKVFIVNGDQLIATFDNDVNEPTITEIAKLRPVYFVMRDASAENDNVLDNFEQIFKHYSPDTIRRII